MNVWNAKQDRRFGRRGTMISVGLHVLVGVLLLFAPSLGLMPEPKEENHVRLVRLKGGGEMRPGWVKPVKAAPDDALVPDNKPQAPKPKPKPEPKPETKPAPSEPKEVEMAVPATPDPEPEVKEEEAATPEEKPAEDPPANPEPDPSPAEDDGAGDTAGEAEEEAPAIDPTQEVGAGVGRKPGPEGEGVGAVTDAEFAGASAYLSRIEAEVQRRFNYKGSASGKVAIYRFSIDRNGRVQDLILEQTSGVPSLDLSARSALLRAKLPPLPRTYPHARLGVSFHFYGD